MQETCNTYILAGVAGSSNVGASGNESLATNTEKAGKMLLVLYSICLIWNDINNIP